MKVLPRSVIPSVLFLFNGIMARSILLILAAAAIRVLMRMPDRVAAKQSGIADRLFVYGNATAQVLRMRGEKVKPGETPMLFARRMDKTMAANHELWGELLRLIEEGGHTMHYTWVKGHATNAYNNRCDEMAVAETKKFLK